MPRAATATTTAAARTDLLGRLGLGAGADDQAVEEAHGRIVGFLEEAPDDLRTWADRRQREADRVFALLTGPDSDLAPLAARLDQAARPAVARPGLPRAAWWALGLVAALALVLGVYWVGRPASDLPAMTSAESAAPTPALDQAKLAELMKKIQANPQDTESLQSIANLYYGAGDYANARTFLEKILAYDATNERALVASGAAAFNGGDLTAAEEIWNKAVGLYPDNAEVHYDLGFLYMTTQRTDQMRTEWEKVVQIAPDSELAKTVQSQVGSVKTAEPSPAPAK